MKATKRNCSYNKQFIGEKSDDSNEIVYSRKESDATLLLTGRYRGDETLTKGAHQQAKNRSCIGLSCCCGCAFSFLECMVHYELHSQSISHLHVKDKYAHAYTHIHIGMHWRPIELHVHYTRNNYYVRPLCVRIHLHMHVALLVYACNVTENAFT